MAHTIKVAGHDLQMLDWPEARKLGWSEQKYLDQYDYTKRLGELLRKERSETKARRAREEYDRDTCESCGSEDGWPHTAVFGGSDGEKVELSLCQKCQNDKGIWDAMLLRNPKKMSPAVRKQVEMARAAQFGREYRAGGKKRHGYGKTGRKYRSTISAREGHTLVSGGKKLVSPFFRSYGAAVEWAKKKVAANKKKGVEILSYDVGAELAKGVPWASASERGIGVLGRAERELRGLLRK